MRGDEARTESGRRVCVEPVANPTHDKGLTQGKPPMEATIKPAGRRRIVTLATALFVIMIVGVAYAAWIADGSGQGYAQSGKVVPISTADTVEASTSSLLYPDGDADVRLQIVNDNPFNVDVSQINNLPGGSISSDDATCDAGHEVTFANQTGEWVVPANGTLNVELPDAASMGTDSNDACQDKTFTIELELKGESTSLTASDNDF